MSSRLPLRLLFTLLLSLLLALLLLVLLYASDIAFRVYDHLQQTPFWFAAGYGAALITLLLIAGWVLLRIAAPATPQRKQEPDRLIQREEEVLERLVQAEEAGVDVTAARAELAALSARRAAGEVHLALFGRVSAGKSSLVRALIPEAEAEVDPRAGTTREAIHYHWHSPAGDQLIVTDLPGLHEPDGSLDGLAREEAIRAHVVVYVVDGDLTRDQFDEFKELVSYQKPTLLALNKADLYRPEELTAIRQRIAERVTGAARVEVVAISAATERPALRVLPNGEEEWVNRPCAPRIEELTHAIQRAIDDAPETFNQLRDAAVFTLTARRLDAQVAAERTQRADRLVQEYTRKAVVGALAAVSPGTDVVIQGFLGFKLVKGLADIYEVPVKEIDIETFLKSASGRAGGLLTLTLALTGNALKAFPGLGTLGGGILHAVAYGLIFDSLGRAVARTLESRGRLAPGPALRSFEEYIGGDLEARARHLARLALDSRPAGEPPQRPAND